MWASASLSSQLVIETDLLFIVLPAPSRSQHGQKMGKSSPPPTTAPALHCSPPWTHELERAGGRSKYLSRLILLVVAKDNLLRFLAQFLQFIAWFLWLLVRFLPPSLIHPPPWPCSTLPVEDEPAAVPGVPSLCRPSWWRPSPPFMAGRPFWFRIFGLV
jgi:hypothetical protein